MLLVVQLMQDNPETPNITLSAIQRLPRLSGQNLRSHRTRRPALNAEDLKHISHMLCKAEIANFYNAVLQQDIL